MIIEQNKPLTTLNSFGIAATAAYWVEYDNDTDLETLLRDEFYQESRKIHIGGGCNLLFLQNFQGIVVHNAIKEIDILEETDTEVCLKVGGGVKWDDFVSYCVENGYWGAECLSYIPGEIAGATVQNIGAYGTELKDIVHEVEIYDRRTRQKNTLSKEACRYAYRTSIFKREEGAEYIVQRVSFKLSKTPIYQLSYKELASWAASLEEQPSLHAIRQKVIAIRQSKLPEPKNLGNAGSFFMNPVVSESKAAQLLAQYPDAPHYPAPNGTKFSAGWLIDQCGWKGYKKGDAGVYEKNALILVNYGKATGTDIAALADEIITEVKSKFEIELKPEVRYV